MDYKNQTPLKIGLVGTFANRRFRIAGRVTLGMEEAGETYYWDEFNLVDLDGDSATLVYEETERGGQWRLFTLFEPQQPLTVPEAAGISVGDKVNLDGQLVRVTLVDESRVYHIEGEAPEGVEVGDVAHYFNAETGKGMIVVSWTGDEIEYYRGLDLPRGAVASAFGLATETPVSSFRSETTRAVPAEWAGRLVKVIIAAAVLFAAYSFYRPSIRIQPTGPVKPRIPPSPLSVGSTGQLNGASYRVQAHAVVEIAQVGRLQDRHEYHLLDSDGNRVLLVHGAKPGANDWILFIPFQPETSMTPEAAAARRAGDKVDFGGVLTPVTELFQSTIRQTEPRDSADLTSGTVLYGFTAQSGTNLFLARWNAGGITFHRGKMLPAAAVAGAFNLKTEK